MDGSASNICAGLLGLAVVALLIGLGYVAFRHEQVIGSWVPFGLF